MEFKNKHVCLRAYVNMGRKGGISNSFPSQILKPLSWENLDVNFFLTVSG